MSPIAASSAIAVTTLTPGSVIRRSAPGVAERVGAEDPVELFNLTRQKVDLAHASVYRQPLVDGNPTICSAATHGPCGRTWGRIVAGPEAAICDHCLNLCREIRDEEQRN